MNAVGLNNYRSDAPRMPALERCSNGRKRRISLKKSATKRRRPLMGTFLGILSGAIFGSAAAEPPPWAAMSPLRTQPVAIGRAAGGFGRLRRVRIRLLRHLDHVAATARVAICA